MYYELFLINQSKIKLTALFFNSVATASYSGFSLLQNPHPVIKKGKN